MRTLSTYLCAALIALFPTLAQAEPSPIVNWLMDEPETLWDRGMDRINQKTERAKGYVKSETSSAAGAWAEYDWDDNEILIRLIILDHQGEITHEECNRVRGLFLIGLGLKITQFITEEWVLSSISSMFSHVGFRKKGRDEDLGKKLSRIMFVNVRLHSLRERAGISCQARVLEPDAPSNPWSSAKNEPLSKSPN